MAVASAKAIISTLPESFFQGDSVTAVDGGGVGDVVDLFGKAFD